jgi:suppressor for copper-sensitivity B
VPAWLVPASVSHGEARSHAGHFLQGAFATLLATPCSAPFLGTAVGFALGRGAVEIVAIFAVLGLGMALPYLAVAAWPRLVAHLPRPGRWMLVLRALLGLALIATAAWLLMVLAAEAGPRSAWAVAVLMLMALALLGGGRRLAAAWRVGAVAVLVLASVGSVTLWTFGPVEAGVTDAAATGQWARFDRDALAGDVADGKTVFVDITADWCITCKVNRRIVIGRGAVAGRLASPGVVVMEGDWTRPDAAISAYLASFGRYGIPFNAVYGPGAPAGIALPELLTEDSVIEALDKASRPAS